MGFRRFASPILSLFVVVTLLGPAVALAQEASPTADPDANKDVVRRFIEAFAAPDPAALDQLLAPDAVHRTAPTGLPPTREVFQQLAMAFEAGIPDYAVSVEEQVVEGDLVATRATVSGTQTGEFLGIPATGGSFAAPAIFIDRVANGQVIEHWDLLDELGILTQIGIVPAPEAPPATPPTGSPVAPATPAAMASPTGVPDLEANKAVARRFLEAFDTGDPAIMDEVLAPDFVYRSAGPGEPTGREGQMAVVAAFATAFPDGQSTVEQLVAEGNTVVLLWTFTGTHHGEIFGIPPTGKQVTNQGIDWYHLEGGQITELWDVIDEVGLLTQLGVLPDPAATPPAGTPAAT